MSTFRAYRIHASDNTVQGGCEALTLDDLASGEVVIHAHFSSVNYKDALAATGKGKILRRFPLVGGVDVSGVVAESSDSRFKAGDEVLVTGCGLGEHHDGGYSQVVRVPADWVVPLPAGLSLFEVMALGTAGLTAALALERLEENGLRPGQGPVVVTGATGGVGSIAIDLLNGRGFEVVAVTGKTNAADYLGTLGAHTILQRQTLVMGARPLEPAQWGGAIDNVGGEMLAWLTRTLKPWGSIASIGLTGGSELHTTVMPFILRGVSVLGITSANCPMERRLRAWQRLAGDLRPRHLEHMVAATIDLEELDAAFNRILSGQHLGRIVVRISHTSGY